MEKPDLVHDITSADWMLVKIRSQDSYAQNLYAALCNNTFQKSEVWPLLAGQSWSCSWRTAGSIVADLRGTGDYMDFYCSGMAAWNLDNIQDGYVAESIITDEVCADLRRLGWSACDSAD